MANDPLNRGFVPTVPPDKKDPPQFGQVKGTVKDVLKYNLDNYFTRNLQTSSHLQELPIVEKYNVMGDGSDPYESVLKVVRRYPDILQKLPHVVVLATSLTQRPFSVGPPLLAAVQLPPRILAPIAEPYNINDGDQLVLVTTPPNNGPNSPINSHHLEQTSTLIFRSVDMPATSSPGRVLAADAAQMINAQALFVHAKAISQGGLNYLQIETGGTMGQSTPNSITVQETSTTSLLNALGFGGSGTATSITGTRPNMSLVAPASTFNASQVGETIVISGTTSSQFNDGAYPITAVSPDGSTLSYTNPFGLAESFVGSWFIGARDDSFNPARPPANRYGYMFDVGVQIQVLTDDDQTRDQVSDLVSSFLAFFAEQQLFTFLGRSMFDETILGENYQIVIVSDLSTASEDEIPVGGSQYDKFYADIFSFTCHVSQYIDRTVAVPFGPNAGKGWQVDGQDFSFDDTLPMPS